jgi:hypothetical protein
MPWPGFWRKYARADKFVIYGGSPFTRRDTQNRVKLDGTWLTLPVVKADRDTLNSEMQIAEGGVQHVIDVLKSKHKVWPLFKRVEPVVSLMEQLRDTTSMMALNVALLQLIAQMLGMPDKFVLNFEHPKGETADERLWNLLQSTEDGGVYVAGQGGKNYMGNPPAGWTVEFIDSSTCQDSSVVELIGKGLYD